MCGTYQKPKQKHRPQGVNQQANKLAAEKQKVPNRANEEPSTGCAQAGTQGQAREKAQLPHRMCARGQRKLKLATKAQNVHQGSKASEGEKDPAKASKPA